jgi:hypothetical protein
LVQAGEAAEAAHWENKAGPVQTAAEAVVPVAGEVVGPDAVKHVIESVAEAIGDLATDEAWEETWQSPGRSNQEAWAREQRIYEEAVARVRTPGVPSPAGSTPLRVAGPHPGGVVACRCVQPKPCCCRPVAEACP